MGIQPVGFGWFYDFAVVGVETLLGSGITATERNSPTNVQDQPANLKFPLVSHNSAGYTQLLISNFADFSINRSLKGWWYKISAP